MDYKDAANLTTKLATSLYLYTSFSAKKVSKSHFCYKFKAIHLTNNILRQWHFSFLFTRSIIEVSLKYHKTCIESSSKHNKGSEDIKHMNDIPPSTNIWTLYAHRLGTQWTKPGHQLNILWAQSAHALGNDCPIHMLLLGQHNCELPWFQ